MTVLCFRLRVLTRAVQAGNFVRVEGAEAIAEALRCNTSVHQLTLVRYFEFSLSSFLRLVLVIHRGDVCGAELQQCGYEGRKGDCRNS